LHYSIFNERFRVNPLLKANRYVSYVPFWRHQSKTP